MSSGFTSSQQKQTQSTALPQAGQMENALYDQLMGMSNQQAGSLTEQNRLQRALLSPHETLQQLNQPFQAPSQTDAQQHMLNKFGQDFMDRFNAGGGTGAGMTPDEFQQYRNEATAFTRDPLEGLRGNQDAMMALQQQIAQNQAAQQAQAQQLTRMQDPYGLTGEERTGIGNVYDQAQNRAMNDMNLQFQDMITSRGLNRYDTPAAEPLARNMGLMLGDINAQRSAALLNRGEANRNFGMNQIAQNANLDQMQFGQGLALNQMTPGATQNLLAPLLQQRMSQATSTSSGSNTPSLYDTVMRGVGTAGSMVMGAYGGGMLGGMGGGLGLSGAPVSNVGGGLGSYAQGGSSFLVNMPSK
jgi:hypothetical protein